MRDVQDFHKYVDMLSKSVTRRPPRGTPQEEEALKEDMAPSPTAQRQQNPAERMPPRTGRGPRPSETREELLRRLLDPTLTLDETARILEVCPTTVRRYTNRGALPCERSAGNQRRFKLSHVLAFKEAQGVTESPGND